MSDVLGQAFVLALAIGATALIGFSGVAVGSESEEAVPGRRWRRFIERMKALGEAYSGRRWNR